MKKSYSELKEDIKKLIEIGIEYTDSNKYNIKKLDTLKIDISNFDHAFLCRTFVGSIYRIDKPWNVKKGKKPYNVLSEYTIDELTNILKGAIVYDIFEGYEGSSIPLSPCIYYEIAVLDYTRAQEVVKWADSFDYNIGLFPLDSVVLYQYLYKYSNQEEITEKMKVKLQVAGYIKF